MEENLRYYKCGSVLKAVKLFYECKWYFIISPEILVKFETLNKEICANRGTAEPRSFFPRQKVDMKNQ